MSNLKQITREAAIYTAVTRSIQVTVEPEYLVEQSSDNEHYYVWAYHIQIKNLGKEVVQLLSRYWNITDSTGHVEVVQGVGVVGEQPTLKENEEYAYTSGTYLPTTSGIMSGAYSMITDAKEQFDIQIPAFSLDVPGLMVLPN